MLNFKQKPESKYEIYLSASKIIIYEHTDANDISIYYLFWYNMNDVS